MMHPIILFSYTLEKQLQVSWIKSIVSDTFVKYETALFRITGYIENSIKSISTNIVNKGITYLQI